MNNKVVLKSFIEHLREDFFFFLSWQKLVINIMGESKKHDWRSQVTEVSLDFHS